MLYTMTSSKVDSFESIMDYIMINTSIPKKSVKNNLERMVSNPLHEWYELYNIRRKILVRELKVEDSLSLHDLIDSIRDVIESIYRIINPAPTFEHMIFNEHRASELDQLCGGCIFRIRIDMSLLSVDDLIDELSGNEVVSHA